MANELAATEDVQVGDVDKEKIHPNKEHQARSMTQLSIQVGCHLCALYRYSICQRARKMNLPWGM